MSTPHTLYWAQGTLETWHQTQAGQSAEIELMPREVPINTENGDLVSQPPASFPSCGVALSPLSWGSQGSHRDQVSLDHSGYMGITHVLGASFLS